MHIIELKVENVKRLRAVQITPEGNIVEITGRNGQGKSSVLDAIWYALGGKGAAPAEPIRHGERDAHVHLDLGELQVSRSWNQKGTTHLTVTLADGSPVGTPQAVLNKLVGDLTFDPLAFVRMVSGDQRVAVRQAAGLDFVELDAARDRLYAQRTEINRQKKQAAAQLDGLPAVDAPAEEVSVAEAVKKYEVAQDGVRQNDEYRTALSELRESITDKEQALANFREQVQATEAALVSLTEDERSAAADIKALVDPDVAAVKARIDSAEETNRKVRSRKAREQKLAELGRLESQSEEKTEGLSEIDRKKSEMIAAAKMPIPGLTFDGEELFLKSIPFAQASQAEQLRLSVAMGLAANPKLRVMTIRDGSLLDTDSMRLLADLAKEHDAQIWIERVSDGESVGVVIEDGMVQSAPEPVITE